MRSQPCHFVSVNAREASLTACGIKVSGGGKVVISAWAERVDCKRCQRTLIRKAWLGSSPVREQELAAKRKELAAKRNVI